MESVKRNKDGTEVHLTDEYKRLIALLRQGAAEIVEALHDVLRILGEGDPDATASFHPPVINDYPGISRDNLVRYTRLLLEAMERVRDRNWDTTTWEEDYELLTNPFGEAWHLDLWNGLHDLQINVGETNGSYRPVYHWGLFARNEPTWPADHPDPREEVEVIRTIDRYTSSLVGLRNQADSIQDSQRSGWLTAIDWLGTFLGGASRGGRGNAGQSGKGGKR
ncbi:hypothetical protein ONS95_011649 [Cadophora gregata]|uniref:uncharacterized protein n=1 Tax=Cadophora gregata TaxID=51156 RepID=UPI0026DB048C|nr:uncharacterized protein ONS95_011649 [Cadophora gregata]KAK0120243.1 hypothetical protein ONS95_011649 [Cadophora gregata]KAK0121280.1 hypothetical protein ONS96_011454 [Cadophora gregata f. sp. sojae]